MLQRKRLLMIVALIAITMLMFGCPSSVKQRRIGFVVTTLSNPYFVDMTNAAKSEAANHPNVELLVQAPDSAVDTERQIQIVENLIAQRVSAICVVPADSKSIVAVIKKANEAGIPVLVLDNKVDESTARAAGIEITTFIGSNNFLGGQLAGKFIVERLKGSGNIAILEGVTGVEAAVQRKSGFEDALKSSPSMMVIASQPADWDREKGLNKTQAILAAHPNTDAIFACNDEMALGAIQAIKNPKIKKRPIVVGFDAIKDALAAIQADEMAATVAQLPAEVGRLGVLTAVDKLDGKPVQPIIPTEVKLITKETLPH
jgi:ribose transport system substrate-binding protein